ncbi:hypothetical protein LSI54_08675 [Nesterenkonia sp. AY15]|uniref:hypothetical protein n=1 Tax=Nesterenkonia sp. AY15 TaxID=2901139 RepID=UPI001F4CD266|nr:hypothetical protein [Nesterenkonia sp. AY15]MCH8571424.1 hypothetical protein [Nesterenkonia sp. AY15]
MTAENTELNDASDGEDLRARYLPVSRKELRRQREAELAQMRTGKRRAPKRVIDGVSADATAPESGLGTPEAAESLNDAEPGAVGGSGTAPAFTTGSESTSGSSSSTAPAAAWEFSLPAPSTQDSTPVSAAVAAAEADHSESQQPEEAEFFGTEEGETPEDRAETDWSEADLAAEDRIAELRELTQAVVAADDPDRVDPELLKKQQALAARAMQANQERLRREQVEADRDDEERRRPLRPESDVITRKTLRAHLESDDPAEPTVYATGSIEPIQARGAHGLEIDAMVEHSTRQGARQSMMGWLVIILALLLIITVGVVLSFIL